MMIARCPSLSRKQPLVVVLIRARIFEDTKDFFPKILSRKREKYARVMRAWLSSLSSPSASGAFLSSSTRNHCCYYVSLSRLNSKRRAVKTNNNNNNNNVKAFSSSVNSPKRSTPPNESKHRKAAERRQREDERKEEEDDAVKNALSKVSGFYEIGNVDIYRSIDACQKKVFKMSDFKTSLAEIGVYHGKSFLALVSLRKQNERCVAIDCFENQAEINRDESGVGDYEKFRKHAMKFCEAMKEDSKFVWDGVVDSDTKMPNFIKVISKDSTKLTKEADFNEDDDGPVRIFSIDGSHTVETTLSDLSFAADECLHEQGVVILDDCFNPDWPGCISGLAKYLDSSSRIVPFAIAYNKVYLCAPSLVETYQAHVARDRNVCVRKKASLFGHECLVCKHGWLHTFHGNDDTYS